MSIEPKRAGKVEAVAQRAYTPADTETSIIPQVDAAAMGSDTSDPTKTAFIVFAADQTYNGESMTQNDTLLGDNSAQNTLIRNGVIYIRYGTTVITTIAANGMQMGGGISFTPITFSAVGGNVELDVGTFGGVTVDNAYVRITSAASNFNLDSIATGRDGQYLIVDMEDNSHNMTIVNNYASASPGYSKINTGDGANYVMTGIGFATFIYNATKGTWRLLSARG